MPQTYDFIVLGGGSAGYAAARLARKFVERVAVIDGADELGGLCILRGCMPSKTLLHSAEILHQAQHGAELGLDIPSAKANVPAMQARKRQLIGEFAEYRAGQLQSGRFDLFRQRAWFSGPREVTLADGTVLTSNRIVVATGSVTAQPLVPGLAQVRALTSDEVLRLEQAPESVIVLGGGVVACELGQYLARIGSKVTLIQRSAHILREHSLAAAETVEKAFEEEGIDVFTDTRIEQVARQHLGGVKVEFTEMGRALSVEASTIFNALGRRPATDGLGLDAAGVKLGPRGEILTDEFQRTNNPAIYAAGDCAGLHEIVHIAVMQGEVAARHACGKPATPVNYDHLVNVVFTDPQVATAGLSEAELRRRGVKFVSASYPFDDHGKSLVMEEKRGYVKIFAGAPDGKILGAECVGHDAAELIHAMAVAVSLGATARDLLRTHWYHPTLSEIWTYPLEECVEKLGVVS